MTIYKSLLHLAHTKSHGLAILIDPDKFSVENTEAFMAKVNASVATHIFVGGSEVKANVTEVLVGVIKKFTRLPVVLFPGNVSQISNRADAILFLSLLSGRNAEYLIGQHVKAIPKLKYTHLEVIPTGYLLIESGKQTAVERVTHTKPMPRSAIQNIADTAKAGELLGMKLIYLEAGSGAKIPLHAALIKLVKETINIPLIVGGGIKNKVQLEAAYRAGADLVVIGTAFEDDELFFEEIRKEIRA